MKNNNGENSLRVTCKHHSGVFIKHFETEEEVTVMRSATWQVSLHVTFIYWQHNEVTLRQRFYHLKVIAKRNDRIQ